MMQVSAETIANALDGRRVGSDKYMALCPSHSEKTGSFSIKQASDKVLVHCFGGCGQAEVIDALRARGLWPEKEKILPSAQFKPDLEQCRALVAAYDQDRSRGYPPSKMERWRYRTAQMVLLAPFTAGEVVEMHLYCLVFASDVRNGKTPSQKEQDTFMSYRASLIGKELPCEY